MPGRGPVPKREDQRRRRNKAAIPTTHAPSGAPRTVKVPNAPTTWHPIAREWFKSLATSGQAVFYEDSDWATARFTADLMSKILKGERGVSQFGSLLNSLMGNLLSTEGDRRRARLELERATEAEEAPIVSIVARAREAAAGKR